MADMSSGIITEHEAVKQEQAPQSNYQPSPEEKKTLKLGLRLFEKAKKHRSKYDEKWLDYYKMYRSKQWKDQRPKYRHSEVFNFIYQTVRSEVATMTDSRPKFEYIPTDPSDREISEILNQVAEHDWGKYNWHMPLSEKAYDARFYGTGLSAMEFNPKANHGLGLIEYRSCDPFYCFPDPDSHDVNKRSRYFIEAEPFDVEVLKEEYPDKAKYIKPDLVDLMRMGDRTDLSKVRYKSPVDTKTISEGTRPDDSDRDMALKYTVYYLDPEVIEEEVREPVMGADPLTGQPIQVGENVSYVQKKKYPNGRKFCMLQNMVLSDGPNPYDDGKFPYARLINSMDPRSFWGISEIEPLESPQKIFNKMISFALDVVEMHGNPIWVVDNTSGVDTDNLFNRAGLVVEKSPNTEVRRESGISLTPEVLGIADRVRQYVNSIAGREDVSRGAKPEGITAASAISALQEAAETRIRENARFLDASLQDSGQMYASRVFQFYDVPRIIRVTNNENAQQYFKFHVETLNDPEGNPMLDEAGKPIRQVKVRDYLENPETGQVSESLEDRAYQIRGEFDVRVTTGSTLGFEKDRKRAEAKQALELGAIDTEEYLKAIEWPNREAVLARMAEASAAAAQAEAMAKGGGQMPPPPMAG